MPYRYAARVQALVPVAELVTLPDATHDIPVSHPQEVSQALLQFFRDDRPLRIENGIEQRSGLDALAGISAAGC